MGGQIERTKPYWYTTYVHYAASLDLKSTFGLETYNERLILVNYGHNQTVGFRERCSQSLFKVGQTQSKLIDGPVTAGLGKIHIRILIIRIEEYGDILVLGKLENNSTVRLREQSRTDITVGFDECHERLILVNYGNNQTVGIGERHGQNLVKVGQT